MLQKFANQTKVKVRDTCHYTGLIGIHGAIGTVVRAEPPSRGAHAELLYYLDFQNGTTAFVRESDLESIDEKSSYWLECQCGKDKHNFATHSRWCDKYVEI